MPGGISIITNFDVQGQFPIDSRMVVSNLTTRDGLLMSVRYEGLRVYVLSERQSYVWQDGTWRVEYNGIYGGSGSLPGNVTVDFGSMSTTVGSASYYFEYEAGFDSMQSFLQSKFIRHSSNVIGSSDMWRGVEFRQQLKYNDGLPPLKKDSSYISFNPSLSGTSNQNPGGLAFGTGYLVSNIPITERMRITSDGNVGIGTNDPKEFLQIGSNSSTQIPFVIHNGSNSAIASNWYYTTSDQYFSQTRGSTRIQFENGEIHFSTRNPNVGSSVLNEAMRIKDKKVGIGTTTPNELLQIGDYTSTQLPLVLHNSGDAAIGHNWYFTTPGGSQYNDTTKGSSRIKFSVGTSATSPAYQGEILFSTKNGGLTNTLNNVMIIRDSKVGIMNVNPGYALDVTGDIRSSDKIRTTNGYFFENSTVANISSVNNIITFIADIGSNFTMNATQNISSKNLRVVTSDVTIASSLSPDNSRHTQGLVFEAVYSGQGSGIYHYQGLQSNGDMGISVLSKFNGQDRESLRISGGGTRIQLGNVGGSNANFANSTSLFSSNSLIDTYGKMHSIYNTRPNINNIYNLLLSGEYSEDNQDIDGNEFRLIQNWTRVGKVINVHFRIEKLNSGLIFPTNGGFRLYRVLTGAVRYEVVNLPIEINNWIDITVNGVCHAFIEPYSPSGGGYATQLTIDVGPPSLPGGGLSSATQLGCLRFQTISGSNTNLSPNTTFIGGNDPSPLWYFRRIYGSYTITINV